MKKVLRSVFAVLQLVVFFCLFSCFHAGLGEEIDLEAPVLSVKSLSARSVEIPTFEGGVYCGKNVTFSGTATDNNRVERVYAQVKWSDEEDFVTVATAKLSGNSWTLDIEFEKEGSCYVKIIAEDPVKNISPKSTKTITLFVDESAPVANGWYIDRKISGITYVLQSKENLEKLDLDKSENKDAAQNVAFTICATATDQFGVKAVSIQIRDSDGNSVATIPRSESSSEYAPKFEVTHEILTEGNPELAHGKHYLQVYYDSEDITEYPESNKSENVEVELGWFIWWPESDEPRVTNSSIVSETRADGSEELSLNVFIKDVISLSVFDDDYLDTAYFALLNEAEYGALGSPDWAKIKENPNLLIEAVKADSSNAESSDSAAREKRSAVFTANDEREGLVTLTAGSIPQTMRLLALAWDKTDAKKCTVKNISVRVTDESSPILLISSPKNNSIPAIDSANKITVEGQTLDSAGCTYLEFVWVPSSVSDKKETAKAWLDSISTNTDHEALAKASGRVSTKDGMKLWSVALTEDGLTGGFYKHKFSFSLDLLADFIASSKNDQAEEKYFLIKLTRRDGNYIYQEYVLAADNLPPVVTGVMPSSDMQIVQDDQNLTLKFYAIKESGLAIDKTSYRIERVDVSPALKITSGTEGCTKAGYNSESGFYEAVIDKSQIQKYSQKGIKPKFRFYAKDIFGNEGVTQYTIVISELPVLKNISTTSSNMCKLGDTIDFTASFSKTLSVTDGTSPRLKIKGITNTKNSITPSSAVYADYASGSGTTSLHFTYTVKEGDTSDGLSLFNSKPLDDNNSQSLTSEKVSINELTEETNLIDSKNIKLDGIKPSVTKLILTTDADNNTNVGGGNTYLKEGRSLTATVTASESVLVQGSPSFVLKTGSGNVELPFTGISGSGANTKITFSKTIASNDPNGSLSYTEAGCIKAISSITDSFGNSLVYSEKTASVDSKIIIDTASPETPLLKAASGTALTLTDNQKFKETVTFKLVKKEADSTIKALQYSKDGGSSWTSVTENTAEILGSSCSFTYRAVDYAGNVSEVPEPVYLDIENNFPAFTVECTNSDGNYKVASGDEGTITLRVSFERPVNIAASSGDSRAYITVSGNGSGAKGGGKAYISDTNKKTGVTSADFKYSVKTGDDFWLKVAKNAVVLTGFTDEYGFTQGGKTLAVDYVRDTPATETSARSGVHCDGEAPGVSSMSDTAGSTGTVFTRGHEIVLTFNEPVIKSGGTITIRRKGNWALPPVLSVTNFNKIVNALPAAQKETLKATLSLQENGSDMEDSEWVNASADDYKNQYYHGRGQFVGPYKKMTQGIQADGKPDIETKYVLDFDMGIWETTEDTHKYGQTFSNNSTNTSPSDPTTTITGDQIRDVLRKAGYDKRVVDVTSSDVTVDGNQVTIKFPAGLCDEGRELQKGIEWEVLVAKGTFMDESGNEMAAYTSSAFFSAGVSVPYVRVDRYSYGLGIKQPSQSGTTINNTAIAGDSTKPTGYVRVRIDCETPGVTINYANVDAGMESTSTTETNNANGKNATYVYTKSNARTKTALSGSNPSAPYTKDSVFLAGNGSYKQSCRQYIVAKAERSDLTAPLASLPSSEDDYGYEGIFQTVVRFVEPKNASSYSVYQNNDTFDDFSIRGTTGWSGEPYISPFPLRDSQNGSPYLRLCYKGKADSSNGDNTGKKDYFWLSYEVLVDTSFSGHLRNNNSWRWVAQWGWVTPGGLSSISGLDSWGGEGATK